MDIQGFMNAGYFDVGLEPGGPEWIFERVIKQFYDDRGLKYVIAVCFVEDGDDDPVAISYFTISNTSHVEIALRGIQSVEIMEALFENAWHDMGALHRIEGYFGDN